MSKLSKDRKKPGGSNTGNYPNVKVFCGPERSFPVPDCAHVTAAKRLIGRYKGPGDKGKIMSCVERKEKSLNCETKK